MPRGIFATIAPAGPYEGTLDVNFENEEACMAEIRFPGHTKKVSFRPSADNEYSFTGKIQSPIGEHEVDFKAHLDRERVYGIVRSEEGTLSLTGFCTDDEQPEPLLQES